MTAKRVLPTPIKKARKESKRFVDHEDISDEETSLSKALADMSPTTVANTAANPGQCNSSCVAAGVSQADQKNHLPVIK